MGLEEKEKGKLFEVNEISWAMHKWDPDRVEKQVVKGRFAVGFLELWFGENVGSHADEGGFQH